MGVQQDLLTAGALACLEDFFNAQEAKNAKFFSYIFAPCVVIALLSFPMLLTPGCP
jgi:hypothetical protein